MIEEPLKARLDSGCYSTLAHHFALFVNTKNRGPNFKWANFPEMATGLAVSWILYTNAIPKDQREEVTAYIRCRKAPDFSPGM